MLRPRLRPWSPEFGTPWRRNARARRLSHPAPGRLRYPSPVEVTETSNIPIGRPAGRRDIQPGNSRSTCHRFGVYAPDSGRFRPLTHCMANILTAAGAACTSETDRPLALELE